MKLYLLPLTFLLPLLLAAQSISHTVGVLDVQPAGEDKTILELAAFGGKLYWAVEGDVNYFSTGDARATTSFPGGAGLRNGLEHLGQVGDLHYFYYPQNGKGYYVEAEAKQPVPRLLRFPLINKAGFTYSNPVMIAGKVYLLREWQQNDPVRHVLQVLELTPGDESGRVVYADTLASVAQSTSGTVAHHDGKLYFQHFQGGGSGPATFTVATAAVTDLGTVAATGKLDFTAVGDHVLLSYVTPAERQVSRFFDAAGGGAEHQVSIRATTAADLTAGLLGVGHDNNLYRIAYTDGTATQLVAGAGGHAPGLFRIDATDALYSRPDGSGGWSLGRTDATPAGTADVAAIPAVAAGGPREFVRFGGYAAFVSANHPVYLFDLATEALQEVAADCSTSDAHPGLATVGDRLYFAAEDPTLGREIHYVTIDAQATVSGVAFEDTNGNGARDPGEAGITNIAIDVTGSEEVRVYTDETGTFHFLAEEGASYTVTTAAPDCYTRSTSPATYSFTYAMASPPDVRFGFQPTADATRPAVYINTGRVRCNSEAPYWVTVKNEGCLPLTGTATVTLPEHATLKSAEPAADGESGNTLTFDIGELQPGQNFYTLVKLNMPDETFAGTDMTTTVELTATGSTGTTVTRSETHTTPLRCAVDPNDMQVSPAREEPTHSNYTQLDETLTYVIRFQNTGNDTAFDVRLEDYLSAHLDLNTFRHVAASHPVTSVKIREGGQLVYRFDNIMLPDSNVNLAGSQGFVRFTVRAHQNLADFTRVENLAGIYFDRNKPVITNTVVSTFVAKLDQDEDGYNFYEDCDDLNAAIHPAATEKPDSGTDENCDGVQATTSTREHLHGALSVYPNPAGRWLRVEHTDRRALTAELTSATGRRVLSRDFTGTLTLPTTDYPAGVYQLRVTDADAGQSSLYRVVLTGR